MDESLYVRLGGRAPIEGLLADFYGRAHKDSVLGPIFAAHVKDWPEHMVTVTDFWSTQTGGPKLYRGGMGRHIRLGLQLEHFSHWLALWETTVNERFPKEIAAELVTIAKFIASRLREMVEGVPLLRVQ